MTEREPLVDKKDKTVSAVWKQFAFKESDMEHKGITFGIVGKFISPSVVTAGLNTLPSFLERNYRRKPGDRISLAQEL